VSSVWGSGTRGLEESFLKKSTRREGRKRGLIAKERLRQPYVRCKKRVVDRPQNVIVLKYLKEEFHRKKRRGRVPTKDVGGNVVRNLFWELRGGVI